MQCVCASPSWCLASLNTLFIHSFVPFVFFPSSFFLPSCLLLLTQCVAGFWVCMARVWLCTLLCVCVKQYKNHQSNVDLEGLQRKEGTTGWEDSHCVSRCPAHRHRSRLDECGVGGTWQTCSLSHLQTSLCLCVCVSITPGTLLLFCVCVFVSCCHVYALRLRMLLLTKESINVVLAFHLWCCYDSLRLLRFFCVCVEQVKKIHIERKWKVIDCISVRNDNMYFVRMDSDEWVCTCARRLSPVFFNHLYLLLFLWRDPLTVDPWTNVTLWKTNTVAVPMHFLFIRLFSQGYYRLLCLLWDCVNRINWQNENSEQRIKTQ